MGNLRLEIVSNVISQTYVKVTISYIAILKSRWLSLQYLLQVEQVFENASQLIMFTYNSGHVEVEISLKILILCHKKNA